MKIEVFWYVTPCYMVNTNVSAVLAPTIFGIQEERTIWVSKMEATRSTGTPRRLLISQVLILHKIPYLRIMLSLFSVLYELAWRTAVAAPRIVNCGVK
jgi:hypothetical protein